MNLFQAAKYFDRLTCTDAYTGTGSFKAQFDLFDDVKRDGLTADRRILSTAPDVITPIRGVIQENSGGIWIVGDMAPDFFENSVIRRKYIIQTTDGLATVRTFAQGIAGSGGFTAYAAKLWIKALKQADVSSAIFNEVEVIFASSEIIPIKSVVTLSGRTAICKFTYETAGGFTAALCDELPDPVFETAVYTPNTMDPVTETVIGSPITLTILRIRWQTNYAYISQASEKYQEGDLYGVVLKSAVTPTAGAHLALSDGTWYILSVLDEGNCWGLHLRRV